MVAPAETPGTQAERPPRRSAARAESAAHWFRPRGGGYDRRGEAAAGERHSDG
jgi:hypothetical protein